jgi:hypothetical protein
MTKTNEEKKNGVVINAMRSDIENIKGFITQEIIKFAKANGGKLPLASDQGFQTQINSLLNANPEAPENKGKAVLSFKATELGIQAKLESLQNKGASPETLQQIRTILKETRNELSQKLATDEGIKELVGKRCVEQLLMNKSDFMVADKKSKEQRFLTPEEKQHYIKSLAPKIQISSKTLETLLDPNKTNEYNTIQDAIYQESVKCFAGKSKIQNIPLLNQKKLQDPKQLKKFSKLIEPIVGKDQQQVINPSLAPQKVSSTVKPIEGKNEQKDVKPPAAPKKIATVVQPVIKQSEQQVVKPLGIAEKLTDALVKNFETNGKKVGAEARAKFTLIAYKINGHLDSRFIDKNLNIIAEHLAKEIDKNKTFLSTIRGDVRISSSNVDKISQNINSYFKQESINFKSKIEGQLAQKELFSNPAKFYATQEKLVAKEKEIAHNIGDKVRSSVAPPSLGAPAFKKPGGKGNIIGG